MAGTLLEASLGLHPQPDEKLFLLSVKPLGIPHAGAEELR